MTINSFDDEKLNTLIDIGQLTSFNSLMFNVLDSAMKLVNCEFSFLFLINDSDKISLKFKLDVNKNFTSEKVAIKDQENVVSWVVNNKKSLILNDITNDNRLNLSLNNNFKNIIAVPLLDDFLCLGVIVLVNKINGIDFTNDDLKFIEIFCKSSAIAFKNSLEFDKLNKKVDILKESTKIKNDFFIAESSKTKDLLATAKKLSSFHSLIFIHGEKGVGKTSIAKQIHLENINKDEPFLKINCVTDSSLLTKKIFTCGEGTVYLNEVACLSLDLQERLLDVIRTNNYNVRVIVSCSVDLEQLVQEGKFIRELYYMLTSFSLYVPPLRQRKEDIEPLAVAFCKKYNEIFNKNFLGFTQNALKMLYDYYWPGNILELKNIIERACMLGQSSFIESSDLHLTSSNFEESPDVVTFNSDDKTLKTALHNFKKKYVIQILDEVSWNQTEAAKIMDIQRTYLSKLMSELDIRR